MLKINEIIATNFHDFIVNFIRSKGISFTIPNSPNEKQEFYKNDLPNIILSECISITDEDKFNAVIIDEGQDFLRKYSHI